MRPCDRPSTGKLFVQAGFLGSTGRQLLVLDVRGVAHLRHARNLVAQFLFQQLQASADCLFALRAWADAAR